MLIKLANNRKIINNCEVLSTHYKLKHKINFHFNLEII
jgi:hypothetical protein